MLIVAVHEWEQMIAAFESLQAAGQPAAMATVAAVEGSAYRHPGARMLAAADGRVWGTISGGCLERDVSRRARIVIDTGIPDVCCYESPQNYEDDATAGDPGASLGCGGRIDVFIEKITAQSPGVLPILIAALRNRQAASIATIIRCESNAQLQRMIQPDGEQPAGNIRDPLLRAKILDEFAQTPLRTKLLRIASSTGKIADVLIERISPPQAIVIFGDGRDVEPLTQAAHFLGWHITAVKRHDDPEKMIDDDSAVVVMGHDYRLDLAVLRKILKRPPRYVGILGPRHRTRRLLRATGIDWEQPDIAPRLFWPIGLDLGAQSSQQIALAIVSEIQAVFSRRSAGHLRDRHGSIHDWPTKAW
jgi:xanthine dehydrogenase accessory factor